MEMRPVDSSNLRSVGYDEGLGHLYVEFQTGATWRYTGVSAQQHEALLAAPSVGSYFSKNIRNAHAGERVS